MRKSFFVVLLLNLTCFYSCDDGDIIEVNLDFDEEFSACEVDTHLVLYKTKTDPTESVSIVINNYSIEDILDIGSDNTLGETKNATFNYISYSNESLPNNLFCSEIPNSEINIIEDLNGDCDAEISTVLTEDDNDGIPAELEGQDPNGDGDFSDAIDTDGDGLPNYLDEDDDGDNVYTENENPDNDGVYLDEDGDGFIDGAQDTDGDGTPDYLDDDDDGDGILTRNEEGYDQNNNPTDDITNSEIGPDYLNPDATFEEAATDYRPHFVSQTYLVTVKVTGISIDILLQDEFDFGVLSDGNTTNTADVTPDFN